MNALRNLYKYERLLNNINDINIENTFEKYIYFHNKILKIWKKFSPNEL